MATVHGFIHTENGGPALGATVRAFDIDMRSEQLLGEAVIAETIGRYQISYTSDHFRRAEKKSADVIVRAFVNGSLRAESVIIFNAREEERVDLTLNPAPVPPRRVLSELEELQDAIEPVREEVKYSDFTDRDVEFLSHEAARLSGNTLSASNERQTLQQRLQFLRQADQFADQTDILLAAFYGWFRILDNRLIDLDELLDMPLTRLRGALERAVAENIIPNITGQIPDIIERIRALRFDRGRLITHRFVAQLIGVFSDRTEQPLARALIDVVDMEAELEEQNFGATTTNGQGIVVLNFVLPSAAPEESTRRLEITIRDENRTLAVTEVNATPNQSEVAVIRVQIQPDEREQTPISVVSSSGLSARLRSRGIETLGDLLANPNITDDEEPEELERARSRAKWTALASELDEERHAHLIESGILSPLDMAAVPRAEFVRVHHESLGGDAETYALHKANLDVVRLFQHQVNSAWFKLETSPGDDDDDPEIPTGVKETLNSFNTCGCKDCSSAVSPAAYLAHLLDWVLTHVKDGETPIPFAELENDLHQPFGDLPATCSAVEDKARQTRLVVESLWRYTGLRDQTDLQMPTPFRNAYRHLRDQLYGNILTNLGTSFQQHRKATLDIEGESPAADLIAAQRRTVADLLGIDEAHIDDLFFNIDLSPGSPTSPTEQDLERLFGFKNTRAEDVFASVGRPDLITWQRERLEGIWRGQDWAMDDYSGEERMPFVDPAVIDASYLRAPLEENPAFSLFEARQEELAAHRQTMIDEDPQQNGHVNLLENELGLSIEELLALFASLQASEEPEQIEQAYEAIAALRLTPAGFTHIMEIDARLQAGEPLGATEQDIDAAWEAVLDILSSRHRRALFPAWVEAEQEIGLVLGPKQFWFPVEPAAAPNPWQATAAERSAWEEALRRRSSRPIIDPDQIAKEYLIAILVFLPSAMSPFSLAKLIDLPPLTSYEIWESRRAWINERLDILRQSREGQPTALDALQAMLEASGLGIGLEVFSELTDLEAEGVDLQPRLAQLSLTLPAYRFLADVHLIAEGNATVSADKWRAAEAILVQAEKHREFAEWRQIEQESEIVLHPDRFLIPDPAPPIDDSPQTLWLRDPLALQQWVATLEARKAQFQALDSALAQAVGDAEASVLPLLRNILIMESNAPGNSLSKKAAWLDGRLLMDMFMDGCQMTTRVSQAIETLQRLVRGVYTQEHIDQLQDLTLDAVEDYENEWPVIGSYATWRAYMLVYLFPENTLHIVPALKESNAFRQLKAEIPRDVSPAQACEAARQYSDFFRDVSNLETEAVCQALTRLPAEYGCSRGKSQFRVFSHIFARSRVSGRVYTATFSSIAPSDLVYQWSPVTKAGEVIKIVGATPHNTPAGKRYLILFVITEEAKNRFLEYLSFDLDELTWTKRKTLSLPHDISSGFTIAVIQKRPNPYASDLDDFSPASDFPTIVAVQDQQSIIYLRRLDSDATDWSNEQWFPLYGQHVPTETFLNDPFQLVGLVQRTEEEYIAVIKRTIEYSLFYRSLFLPNPLSWPPTSSSKDDLRWRRIWDIDEYRGSFPLPLSRQIAVFSNQGAWMRYRSIGPATNQTKDLRFSPTDELSGNVTLESEDDILIEFVKEFNRWLEQRVGVSLDDYFLGFAPDFFAPASEPGADNPEDPGGANYNPFVPGNPGVLQTSQVTYTFSGSLLKLLTLPLRDFSIYAPPHAHYRQENKSYYLIQLIDAGVRRFTEALSSTANVEFIDSSSGKWRLADYYINQLSKQSNDSLTQVVGRLSSNRIQRHLSFLHAVSEAGGISLHLSDANIVMREREGDELGEVRSILGNWSLQPLSGDGVSPRGPSSSQAVVLQSGAAFITRLVRDGQQLQYKDSYPPTQITPDNDGPYDIAPLREMRDLQLHREEIKYAYQTNNAALTKAAPAARSLLKEAFSLVPIFLGYQLHQSGRYEEALSYYRLVFDDRQAPGKRKIDYSLKLEESLPLDYDRVEEFLTDSSNSHAIAATRENTYTRHILLLIIRCLIDYADALFSRDNVTDNARARELYSRALRLLDLDALKPGESKCDNIIGELEVEVVESMQFLLLQFQPVLAEIKDADRLRLVVDSVKTINQDTSRLAIDRLEMMREVVATALAETPAPKSQKALRESKQEALRSLENQFVAAPSARALMQKTRRRRSESNLVQMAEIVDVAVEELKETPLPWLRQQAPEEEQNGDRLALTVLDLDQPRRPTVLKQIRSAAPLVSLTAAQLGGFAASSGVSFDFCIPQNPVINALRTRAENNLTKLRTCRNIAGMLREIDPYGAPIGIGSGLVSPDATIFSGIVEAPPTPYRYAALIARAKELVTIAQQIESGYQAALENAEREALSVLQAEQSVEMAGARVTLQDLRLNQANDELGLAQLQKGSAVLRETTYAGWIAAGKNEHEKNMLDAHRQARDAQIMATNMRAAAQLAEMTASIAQADVRKIARLPLYLGAQAAYATFVALGTASESIAISQQTRAQIESIEASFERRQDEWQLQQGLAALDAKIGDQQIQLAQDGIAIVQQERVIAGLEHTHAVDVLEFLLSKTFTEEMYRWIAGSLADVYRFFLREAASIALLAERQLAFERQQAPLKVIRPDYWNVPVDGSGATLTVNNVDRLGLTGSARLLKDIYQLDQYAFETRKGKQNLATTLDLAQRFPTEFQQFRETGVLIFETPLSLIERQLPGYYLCLIQQVSVSVVALIPPTYGIRASLTSAGTSRVIVGGDTFQTVTIRNLPERIALTSATTTSGVIELEPDSQSLLRPFEGVGFDTLWELRMPKAANPFDYNTIATVLFTVQLTALHSFDYERQVIEAMDRRTSANRAFYFRQEFADQWYDLHNPDQTATPMTVQFETRREDFPPNLENLRIDHVLLYFVGAGNESGEIVVQRFSFTEHGSQSEVGGGTTSVDGVISTRRGNGTSWLPMIGKPPFGLWEFALPDTPEIRNRFQNEEVEDILLIITFTGFTPEWPR